MTIRQKLIVYLLAAFAIIFISAILVITNKSKQNTLNDAENIIDTKTREYANEIEKKLNKDMYMAKALANSFIGYEVIPKNLRLPIYNKMLYNVYCNNPGYLSLWASFELHAYDSGWNFEFGRARTELHGDYLNPKTTIDTVETSGFETEKLYYKIRTQKKQIITEPYYYTYEGENKSILETSLCVPIIKNNVFSGLVGFDVELKRFQDMIKEIKPYPDSYSFLLSNDGIYIGHPTDSLLGKSIEEKNKELCNKHGFLINTKLGKTFSFYYNDSNIEWYISTTPIYVGETKTPWSFSIAVPKKIMTQKANTIFNYAIGIGIIGLILIALIILFISKTITKPLQKISQILKEISLGNIDKSLILKTNNTKDEINEMNATANRLITGLNDAVEFSDKIGTGELNSKYEKLSDKDKLGESLINTQKSLLTAKKEEENRIKQDKQQNWATNGIAKFSDILRQNNENINELSYQIISNLVKYLGANQGGMFIINDNDKQNIYIEQTAAFAFNRRKYKEKRIEYGEGLIGRCIREQETVYMIDIPNNYIEITSGLGKDNPSCLLIVPLKVNNEIFGVVEIASFTKLETYKIDFVEKIAESIASTISMVKINTQTAELLKESKEQAEKMAQQEEEMRQNMEEMQATQEESARREAELSGLVSAINASTYRVEYDLNGNIIEVNDELANLVNLPKEQIIGMSFRDGLNISDAEFNAFWNDLRNGISKKEINKLVIKGKEIWLSETYTPTQDTYGNISSILKLATDITESKQLEHSFEEKANELANEFKNILNAIDNSVLSYQLTIDGKFIDTNDRFINLIGIDKKNLIGKYHGEFMTEKKRNHPAYQNLWAMFANGKTHSGGHQYFFNNKETWVYETFTPIKNKDGKYDKVMVLANDITKVRKQEEAYKKQIKELEQKIKQ